MAQSIKSAFLIASCMLSPAVHATPTAEVLVEYRNGVWWDGRSEVSGSRFVRGDRFVVDDGGEATDIVDLEGAVVTAPFGEGHNHNIVRPIFNHVNREYLSNGVFYVKIPGIYGPQVTPIRALLNRPDTVDATFSLGVITSPGGHPVPIYTGFLAKLLYDGATYEDFRGFAFHEVQTKAHVSLALRSMIAQGTDFVKATLSYSERFRDGYRAGMNPDLLPFLVERAHAAGKSVSLHVDSAEDFRRGVAAGVDEIAHLPGYMWGPNDKAADHLLTVADARRAAESGTAVVSTTHFTNVVASRSPIPKRVVARLKEVQAQNLLTLLKGRVEIRIGSDVYDRVGGGGEGANPTRAEVENLVRLGVFDTKTALSRWIDTGRTIFPKRRIGCFEAGCEASFLVFAADPRESLDNLDQLIKIVKQGIDVTNSLESDGATERLLLDVERPVFAAW